MADIRRHWDYLIEAWEAAKAAPLSARKAMLVAGLIDAYVDRLGEKAAGDILDFRAEAAREHPAIGQAMALHNPSDPARLVTEAVAVPLEDYGSLGVADFMVSLYNDHSVQRVRLVTGAGERLDLQAVLAEAIAALERIALPK